MTDQTEIIVKLSQVIVSRFTIYKWIAALTAAVSTVLDYVFFPVSFLSAFFGGLLALSIFMLVYFHHHQHAMLSILKEQNGTVLTKLENYLQEKQEYWENNYWFKVILLVLYGLITLFCMIFLKDSQWSPQIAGLFPTFLLAFMLLGWSKFNDKILLHDIERSRRD